MIAIYVIPRIDFTFCSSTYYMIEYLSDVGAEYASTSPRKKILGKIGLIWAKLTQNLGKTEAKFGQK